MTQFEFHPEATLPEKRVKIRADSVTLLGAILHRALPNLLHLHLPPPEALAVKEAQSNSCSRDGEE